MSDVRDAILARSGLGARLANLAPADRDWYERARSHHASLTKPPRSLGRLEDIGCRLCAIQRRLPPEIGRPRIFVLAADHGVAREERVSPYPSDVTCQMVVNFIRGGAAISAIARVIDADLHVVDIGVDGTLSDTSTGDPARRLWHRKVARGTKSITSGAAMSWDELERALQVGVELADDAAKSGVRLIVLGEMGIGNTTVASAVTAALLDMPAREVTGRGTGADEALLASKIGAVERALAQNRPDARDPLAVLRTVGGIELAGLCGLTIAAARHGMAVVSDGFITTAALAIAVALAPTVTDYVFAGHRSVEPGHDVLLRHLDLDPLLDLDMRLGEGSGAALAVPLVVSAVAVMRDMASFDQAGVSGPTREPE